MKELFQKIEAVEKALDGWGWCSLEKATTLAAYVLALRPECVCEIGTFGGRSAIPMMLACQQLQRGKVICIDPWQPEESVKGQVDELNKKWWGEVANHELVYQRFVHQLEKLNLWKYADVRRITSDAADVPDKLSLFHCDGNHGPQALTDTMKFAANVIPYGICVLDDLDWHGGHVRQAEKWLLENGFTKLHDLGTGAVYLRNGK